MRAHEMVAHDIGLAAANACQGFCSTELDLFRSVLGPGVTVERAEHIIKGDQRCVYKVTQESAKGTKD